MRPPKFITPLKQTPQARRVLLPALLLAAFAVAVFAAGSALAAALVKNGSFEKDSNSDGIPNNWTPSGFSSKDKRVCNQSYAGMCSLKEVGDTNAKGLAQDIAVTGEAGNNVRLTFWAKGKDLVAGPTQNVQVTLVMFHTDGSSESLLDIIPEGATPWSKYTVEYDAAENFDELRIFIYNDADGGKVWLDKFKLVIEP